MIQMADLRPAGEVGKAIEAAWYRVTERGHYILGGEGEAFEDAWATYCGAPYCVAVASGFDALRLALSVKQPYWRNVFVSAFTCLPTWLAIEGIGRAVGVNPYENTYQMDASQLEKAIESSTNRGYVIIPVHLYGLPCDLDAIGEVAREHGLTVIEDACQAHGTFYKGRHIGSHGNTCAWSFYPTKNLGAFGDAGAVTTHDANVARRVRELRNYCGKGGVNSRMDELQAAILLAKLPYLAKWNALRKRNVELYTKAFTYGDYRGISFPKMTKGGTPNWHQFVIRHTNRDALSEFLWHKGIQTQIHYPTPPHVALGLAQSLPVTERLCREVLSLPVGPHLNEEQIMTVVRAVKEFTECNHSPGDIQKT